VGFKNFDTVWEDAATRVMSHGESVESRVGLTREVLGLRSRLDDVSHNWLHNPGRALSAQYAAGELVWYLSGRGSGEQICAYAPSYKKYLVDGVAPGAYGPRIQDALGSVLFMLSRDGSRQAVVPIIIAHDIVHAAKGVTPDVPCTLSLQFIRREGKLHLITTMRSNDLWLGMPYDVWCFTTMQRMIAGALHLECGFYQHQVGSMHAYEKDYAKVTTALEFRTHADALDIDFSFQNVDDMWDAVQRLVINEVNVRRGKSEPLYYGNRHIITTLSHLCAVQHGYDDVVNLCETVDPVLIMNHCPKLRSKLT